MPTPSSPRKRPRILVTDDSRLQRHIIRQELAGLDVEVIEVGDGVAALQAIRVHAPDLVTLDIEMPMLDGFRVLEQVKASNETITLPIILISGHAGDQQRLRAMEAGAIEYFRKPFPPGELQHLVKEVLSRLESNRNRTVFCLESSKDTREKIRDLLQTNGYRCECFDDERELSKKLAEEECDLLIVDLNFRDRAAYRILEESRDEPRLNTIAKMGLTEYGVRRDLLTAFRFGIDDFVSKPFYPEEVLARIDNQLRIKAEQQELRHIATIDPLTKLHNRGEMARRLEAEISRARRDGTKLGVLMLDIDHFKRLNDTYGHPFGDQVLHTVAYSLQDDLRVTDTVGRYGGEEFMALLPKATEAGVRFLAERLRQRIANLKFPADEGTLKITISIGGCVWPSEWLDNSTTLGEFIRPADRALYRAKEQGRNQAIVRVPTSVHATRPPSSFRRDSTAAGPLNSSPETGLLEPAPLCNVEIAAK